MSGRGRYIIVIDDDLNMSFIPWGNVEGQAKVTVRLMWSYIHQYYPLNRSLRRSINVLRALMYALLYSLQASLGKLGKTKSLSQREPVTRSSTDVE